MIGDAIRLWRVRDELDESTYQSRRQRLTDRLHALLQADWNDANAKRLIKRLRRHAEDLFTFLDKADVPFENNLAERLIRPAVIARKNSYGQPQRSRRRLSGSNDEHLPNPKTTRPRPNPHRHRGSFNLHQNQKTNTTTPNSYFR